MAGYENLAGFRPGPGPDMISRATLKIINNSAGDCSISFNFRADFDHLTLDIPRAF